MNDNIYPATPSELSDMVLEAFSKDCLSYRDKVFAELLVGVCVQLARIAEALEPE